ncbi:MAG: thrombospondin type 3 repeat-containing protein [Myxococcota bacterium]
MWTLASTLSLALVAPGSAAPEQPTTSVASETAASPWLGRFRPLRGQWELGALTGVTILGARHDYYDPDTAPQVRLGRAAPIAGLRAAYFPLSLLGVEAEGWGLWTRVPARADAPAFAYALRAHAILQLPLYRLVPFIVGGYGITGIRSGLDAVGSDVDPAGHYGAGLKLMADGRFAVRLEGRHMMTPARARRRQVANHFSIMVGVSVRLGPEPAAGGRRHEDVPAPVAPAPAEPDDGQSDGDGDGVRDRSDACPTLAGSFPHGCPQPDFDEDGVPDAVDPCPNERAEGSGCPAKDSDGDGRLDAEDRCPWEAGVAPDGCVAPDLDADGVPDADDKCPTVSGDATTGCPPPVDTSDAQT